MSLRCGASRTGMGWGCTGRMHARAHASGPVDNNIFARLHMVRTHVVIHARCPRAHAYTRCHSFTRAQRARACARRHTHTRTRTRAHVNMCIFDARDHQVAKLVNICVFSQWRNARGFFAARYSHRPVARLAPAWRSGIREWVLRGGNEGSGCDSARF